MITVITTMFCPTITVIIIIIMIYPIIAVIIIMFYPIITVIIIIIFYPIITVIASKYKLLTVNKYRLETTHCIILFYALGERKKLRKFGHMSKLCLPYTYLEA